MKDAMLAMKGQKHAQDMALSDASTAADIRRKNLVAANKPEEGESD